ncbi:MAG TPA: hypothetical protein VGP06_19655 [Janthinobacterium sp.]|nr:hypothetical protein [Janthinobacterium sp.]
MYYLHLQRHPEPVAQKAAANHDVGNAAAGNKPALILAQADTSATAVPAAKAARSKEQASLALLALPELTSWSAQLEKNSGGKWHGALIEDDPAPRIVNGKTYYQFSFVEDGADSVHRLESFLAAANSDDILVEDDSSDELLSLERWRKEKHPMQRVVGGGN